MLCEKLLITGVKNTFESALVINVCEKPRGVSHRTLVLGGSPGGQSAYVSDLPELRSPSAIHPRLYVFWGLGAKHRSVLHACKIKRRKYG